MQNDKINANQAIFCIVMFSFGSSVVIGISTALIQDSLVAILIATVMAVPIYLLYSRIFVLFPEKNIFEIAEELFGKIGGKVISILLFWYTLHLAALVIRDFSEFTQITSLQETPQLAIMIILTLTTIYVARSGMHNIGKGSVISFFLVSFVVFLTFLLATRQLRFDDLFPLFEHSPGEFAQTSFDIFAFPFGEAVVFLCLGYAFPKEKQHKIFMIALLIILVMFLNIFIRNFVVLGERMMEISLYPSYITARIIEISDFVARVEGLISSNFLLGGIIKISVCILAAANGAKSIFGLKDAKTMIVPMGILSLALCTLLYSNTTELFTFSKYYAYYAIPFQIIIPLIIFIAGEIYVRKQKKNIVSEPVS